MKARRMHRSRFGLLALVLGLLTLAACSGGQVRRVSEPAARIQQLTVRDDGSWSIELRLENFSSIPMRFDSIDLALKVGERDAGRLVAQPAVSIGPESADVVAIALRPGIEAKVAAADALATSRSLPYLLRGTLQATPEEARSRSFDIDRASVLSPAPGLPGVLR